MSAEFDASEFFDLFVQEAKEQIEALDRALIGLEQQQHAPDLIEQIFRAAHSLKASAASQGFDEMSHISHALENVFDRIRNDELTTEAELIDLLLAGVDALKTHLNSAIAGQAAPDAGELLAELQGIGQGPAQQPQHQASKPQAEAREGEAPADLPAEGAQLRIVLDPDCAMPAARAWLILQQLEAYGELLYARPSMDQLKAGEIEFEGIDVSLSCELSAEQLLPIVGAMPDVAQVSLPTDEFDGPEAVASTAEARPTDLDVARDDRKASAEQPKVAETQATVRVNVENIDALMNLVGELVISRTRLTNLSQYLKEDRDGTLGELSQNFDQVTAGLGTIVSELQERVMQTRMVPVNQVFGRFPRLVRDVARREGKLVDLVVEGGETELDRSLIEDIVDPLTHLLRNAVSHGIETPEARRAAGKPEKGTVRLSAHHEQSMVVIQVADDGAGIDPESVRKKAVESGLMTQQQAASTPDRQMLETIFASGFSTAAEVSDVSGRGVGMDVVKSNIDKLGGQVEIESGAGQGTTISLRLPLTLAIIRGLLVVAADVIFALPLASVVRILQVDGSEIQYINGVPVVVVDEDAVPLVSLAEVSEFQKFEPQEADKTIVVMIGDGREIIGLTIDELMGDEELVIQPLGEVLQDVRVVNGAAVLGDGRLALIVDVGILIRTVGEQQMAREMRVV